MRTLSKAGLAGLRLGVLAGPAAWIGQFDKVRLPYNIGSLTQITAKVALRHPALWQHQAEAIRAERGLLAAELGALPGVRVYPSDANFLLFQAPTGLAPLLYQSLQADGVLIKLLDGTHPALTDCLRVTVGLPEENARFLDALARGLASVGGK